VIWDPVLAADFFYAFRTSNLVGKTINLLLLGSSMCGWAIILTKGSQLGRALKATRLFFDLYKRDPDPLHVFRKKMRFDESPVFQIYAVGCKAVESRARSVQLGHPDSLFSSKQDPEGLTGADLEIIRSQMDRATVEQVNEMEDMMGILATLVSGSPLLGLLGTVWGVMDAFSAMALHGMVVLGAVAPGITGALSTTVLGLLVAIPCLVAYNWLNKRIQRLVAEMESFWEEFVSTIAAHYARGK